MAVTVSLINMKGGVGKTTIASQLAFGGVQKGLKVLAIDLDPQSNLSQAVMGVRKYVSHLRGNSLTTTIVQIFEDSKHLNLRMNIQRGKRGRLDLIPSSLELSRTLKNPTGKELRLANYLSRISHRYDLILIDCAPTESILTDAAYFASQYVIVPVKPEFMATIALPLLARSIKEFRLENEDHEVEIAGLVFNHSSEYSQGPEERQSVEEVREQAREHGWHIFDNSLGYSASYPRAAREKKSLYETPYARRRVKWQFNAFKNEVFRELNIRKVFRLPNIRR